MDRGSLVGYSPRGCKESDVTEATEHMVSPPLSGTLQCSLYRSGILQETQDQSLGQGDPLEKEKGTHSSILAWRIPWSEEPVGYSPEGPSIGLD